MQREKSRAERKRENERKKKSQRVDGNKIAVAERGVKSRLSSRVE